MKKIVTFLVLFLLPIEVLAEGKEYRFYYLEKEYSEEFYELGKNNIEYPNLGTVWYYSEEEQVSLEKPELEEDIIKEIPIIKYQEYQKVRYIIIDQTYSNSKINLQEIEVFEKENKIEYKIQCSTCSTEFFAKIQNTKLDYEFNYIENNTKIILDLQKEYFPDDLTIKFHLGGATGKIGQFRVTINNSKDINDIYYRYFVNETLRVYLESKKDLKTIEHEERLNEEIQEKKGVSTIDNAKILELKTEYTYKKRLYQYYKEEKHYVDGYYQNLPGLIKDETNFRESTATTESFEKEQVLSTPIIEYLEKQVFVPIVRKKEVPIITEKIKYQTKEVKVPITMEQIIEKETSSPQPNYPIRYLYYLLATLMIRKMSLFKR